MKTIPEITKTLMDRGWRPIAINNIQDRYYIVLCQQLHSDRVQYVSWRTTDGKDTYWGNYTNGFGEEGFAQATQKYLERVYERMKIETHTEPN